MFKSKKIVALVLCAMMLFVPVAAMADVQDTKDYLDAYISGIENADKTGAGVEGNFITELASKITAYNTQNGTMKTVAVKTKMSEVRDLYNKLEQAKKDSEKALEDARDGIAELESYKSSVESFGIKTFVGATYRFDNTDGKKEADAKKAFEAANQKLPQLKAKLEDEVAKLNDLNVSYKAWQDVRPYVEGGIKANKSYDQAKSALDSMLAVFKNLPEKQREAFAPVVASAWKNFVEYANAYQKKAAYDNLDKAIKKLVDKANTKYEVMSTGEKGWILSDEAKNGCLKDVAEFKVEKKDGEFVGTVYGADGKEMKVGQQLTVYRPIGKDVKVLKARVDGKEVTFAISTRGEQKYVSVSVVY